MPESRPGCRAGMPGRTGQHRPSSGAKGEQGAERADLRRE